MKQYDSYKDSGVEWIGEVPSHWKHCRFKDFMKLSTTASDSLHKIGLENIESATGRFIETNTEFEGNGVEFKKNSIVYGKLRPYLQKVWLADFEGNAVGDFFVFNAKSNSMPLYIKYLLLSDGFTKEADGSTFGAKMPRVSSDFILTLHFCLPPIAEQTTIATYLDKKCSEIDNVISAQQKRIALLQELKQSVITHAVTKGLNPNVEMKDSGVEWIGEVPKHWEIKKLKYITFLQSGDTIKPSDFKDEGEYPVYGGNGFRGYTDKYTNEGLHVLIGRQGALCGNINYANGRFYASEHAIVSYPLHGENVVWLGETMRTCDFNRYSQTAAQPGIAVNVIKNIAFPYPSIKEQNDIANYLNKRCASIDNVLSKAQHQVELLQEYKQSLITEVVTGKRKVS